MWCAQGSQIFIGALVRNLVGVAGGGGRGQGGQTTQGTGQEM